VRKRLPISASRSSLLSSICTMKISSIEISNLKILWWNSECLRCPISAGRPTRLSSTRLFMQQAANFLRNGWLCPSRNRWGKRVRRACGYLGFGGFDVRVGLRFRSLLN
jgi:hypothetical protein